MTKPRNIRSIQRAAKPPPARPNVEAQYMTFADAPGLVLIKLSLDGKTLYLPARQLAQMPGWAALQLQPQFLYFHSEADAETFHQQQVQQFQAAQQAQAAALWTPEKQRKGLVN